MKWTWTQPELEWHKKVKEKKKEKAPFVLFLINLNNSHRKGLKMQCYPAVTVIIILKIIFVINF